MKENLFLLALRNSWQNRITKEKKMCVFSGTFSQSLNTASFGYATLSSRGALTHIVIPIDKLVNHLFDQVVMVSTSMMVLSCHNSY